MQQPIRYVYQLVPEFCGKEIEIPLGKSWPGFRNVGEDHRLARRFEVCLFEVSLARRLSFLDCDYILENRKVVSIFMICIHRQFPYRASRMRLDSGQRQRQIREPPRLSRIPKSALAIVIIARKNYPKRIDPGIGILRERLRIFLSRSRLAQP